MTPSNLVEIFRHLGRIYCLYCHDRRVSGMGKNRVQVQTQQEITQPVNEPMGNKRTRQLVTFKNVQHKFPAISNRPIFSIFRMKELPLASLMHIFLTFFQICSGSSLLVPIFPVLSCSHVLSPFTYNSNLPY